MSIPDKAVDAAARARYGQIAPGLKWEEAESWLQDEFRRTATPQLEAAARFIRAEALRDEADRVDALEKSTGPERVRAHMRAVSLRLRADELEEA